MADGFDASVINAFNPQTKLKTADQIAAEKLEIQARQQSAQLGEQQIAQARLVTQAALKQKADQEQAAQVFNQNLDADKTYQGLMKIDPAMATSWQDAQHKRAIQTADEQAKTLQLQKDKVAEVAKLTAPVAIAMQAGKSPEEVKALYDSSRKEIISRGLATAEQVPEQMDPQHVMVALNAATDAHTQIGEKQAQAEAAAKTAKDGFDMKLAQRKQESDEAEKAATLAQTATRDKNTAAYQRGELGMRGAQLEIERQKFNNDPNNADLGSASPSDLLAAQSLVKGGSGIKDYSTRNNNRQKLINLATQLDPEFTTDRKDVIKNFKSGKDSADIAQLNMLAGHLERFDKNSNATGVLNSFNPASSDNARLNKDINDVAGVMGKLVKGSVITAEEGRRYMSGLNSHIPSVRAAAADEMRELVGGKLDASKTKFKNGSGLDFDTYFGKDAVKNITVGDKTSGFDSAAAQKKYGY